MACHLAEQRQPLPVALELALLQVRAVARELLELPLLHPLRLACARLPLQPPARLREHGGQQQLQLPLYQVRVRLRVRVRVRLRLRLMIRP